jgi:hypothetical protein
VWERKNVMMEERKKETERKIEIENKRDRERVRYI